MMVNHKLMLPLLTATMKLAALSSGLLAPLQVAAGATFRQPPAGNATYDYIVAGGGTAGIVAAERFAASGSSVLLLERGGPSFYVTGNNDTMAWNDTVTMYDVPGMADYTGLDPDLKYCRDVSIAAGCLLGGSSMLNALMFVKPRAADFQAWPAEWHWDNGVSSAAEKFYERQGGSILPSADGKRYDDKAFDVVSRFLSANGWTEQDGLHDPEAKELMYTHPPWSITDGLRDSPARSVLPDAEELPNFTLQLHSKVLRALRTGGRMTGVELERSDGEQTTREIVRLSPGGSLVLAGGTHSTPRILFNSGIGPAEQIEVVQKSNVTNITLPPHDQWLALPVGENLRDHPSATVNLTSREALDALPSTAWTDPDQQTVDLFARGSGLLSQSGQRLNFWTSVNSTVDGITRHVQGTVRAADNTTLSIIVYLTHGLTSVGRLGIQPDGTTYMPQSPLLNTEGDRDALTSFIDDLLGWARQPGSLLTPWSNATAAEIVAEAGSGTHYMGSTQMGVADDGRSVVDVNTRVWRTENLFVVDGSMHPQVPTGNTQAPIMVAASYAAERILKLHGSS